MPIQQINQPFRLKSTLGDDELVVLAFEGVERLSTPFRYVLKVGAPNGPVDMKGLLYKPLVLSLRQSNNTERHIHGNISAIRRLPVEEGFPLYEIVIVPWLWFLNLFTDCRMFQNMNVPDILSKVFADRGLTNVKLDLQGSYPALEYCVQYNETDFNFVSRLMEQEGIYYFFEQSSSQHTLVLSDVSTARPACPHKATVKYVPFTDAALDDDHLSSIEEAVQVHVGNTFVRDWDFEKPSTDLSAVMTGTQKGEIYEFPAGYTTRGDGDRYARVRLEEQECRLDRIHANGNCRGVECGYKFTLQESPTNELNIDWLIISLNQRGENSVHISGQREFDYSMSIEAIPASVPFRPPRLAVKPVIRGSQTAVVAGKSGEEIWTDKYGRVKVHFHWDREGHGDETSSCWIRVAQTTAGQGWGAMSIPRIGQEVIVSFIEGDPDRPIITGRVYNAEHMPPYQLPGKQNVSTMKSLSSKGGGGYNELRLDDSKDSEQIYLHAQKDIDIRIENDRKEWVKQDRHLMVLRDKFEKITNNDHQKVEGKRLESVGTDHNLKVGANQAIEIGSSHSQKVSSNSYVEAGANYHCKAGSNIYIEGGTNIVLKAGTGITLAVGGNFITIDSSGVYVKGTMVMLNSGGAALPGTSGQTQSRTDPTDAKEAATDAAGSTDGAPSPAPQAIRNIQLHAVTPTVAQPEEQEHETTPVRSQSSTPGQTEGSTFPRDVDPEALAQVLVDAAKSGVPFCEECQRAAAQNQQRGNNQWNRK